MAFPEDGVDARLVYPGRLPTGMETLLHSYFDVIFILDLLVNLEYVITFVINTNLYHYIVVACMNKQILAYM